MPRAAITTTTTTEHDNDNDTTALIDETQAAIDGLITTANRSEGGRERRRPTVDDYATSLESALDKID